jgi:hypothetical protein
MLKKNIRVEELYARFHNLSQLNSCNTLRQGCASLCEFAQNALFCAVFAHFAQNKTAQSSLKSRKKRAKRAKSAEFGRAKTERKNAQCTSLLIGGSKKIEWKGGK